MQHLPQLAGRPMVTDGGLETDLIFNHGVELEEFAAYPLLWDAAGRALLTDYYDGYASIAARAGAGLLLESPTWRANRDWGARLGHSTTDLDRANADAVDLLRSLRRRYAAELGLQDVVVVGVVGPRGDGYRSAGAPNPAEAAEYHHAQVAAFAEAGVDVVTAYTLTTAGEAIGITQSCREQGLPVAISFTVEVDGRLPDRTTLAETISEVDDREAPDYYLVNCAHPEHVLAGLDADDGSAWRSRLLGLRYNASTRSHAELDDADDLDAGDLETISAGHDRVVGRLTGVTVVGGCCGTDASHVARLWDVDPRVVDRDRLR
ncbi:homocysteine S-methyltransferase family protein [Terrabacter sp. Ter38]|uniref:homocysteine S-methyltransferase family protein n=1 Tax=Terrabacter sp. Ter38 TaxID=2926030 RepID=UPI002119952A|nr:homocysteine S-methyltransferase family protein [Terrabacter sp. Ter38]